MFGYLVAAPELMTEPQLGRYRAAYCGLCHALKERFGQASRFSLTYDMAFLTLLLGSLYEPQEQTGRERCVAHPMKPHAYLTTRFTDYAADLSVALAYHKCLDDWNDDRSVRARAYAGMLERAYGDVKQRLPRQCAAIEDRRSGSYNPLSSLDMEKEDIDTALTTFAGRATVHFEKLPLEQDLHLLRSVLYSGIWQKRNAQETKRLKREARKATQDRTTEKDA